MSRTSARYGGAALAGSLALGFLINQTAVATETAASPIERSVIAEAIASLPSLEAPAAAPLAVTTGVVVPALTQLTIPDIGAAATSRGYALRDVLIDAAPDLAERDLAFVLQRQDGDAWVEAARGTTSGTTDVATVAAVPAGSYRVVIPAQFGMAEFVGSPFAHQPRQLTAALSHDSANGRTTVDVSPNPAAGGAYQFTLERKGDGGWQGVSSHGTSTPDGAFAFRDLPTGTYRITVPDQADSLGAVSNEVAAVSAADRQRRAAQAAAAAQAASERATSSSSSSSGASTSAPVRGASAVVDAAPVANAGGIVGTALAQVGDRYRLGGNGPSIFDCSGLTSYAYRAAGKSIPRTAASQYSASAKVANPRPGDLVFFLNGAQHVGVYIGNGKMVHAANPRRGVEVSSIHSGWYARTFTGFGRF